MKRIVKKFVTAASSLVFNGKWSDTVASYSVALTGLMLWSDALLRYTNRLKIYGGSNKFGAKNEEKTKTVDKKPNVISF